MGGDGRGRQQLRAGRQDWQEWRGAAKLRKTRIGSLHLKKIHLDSKFFNLKFHYMSCGRGRQPQNGGRWEISESGCTAAAGWATPALALHLRGRKFSSTHSCLMQTSTPAKYHRYVREKMR